eukprot:jgi/Mesvir1/23791/Mv10608-RA.2
MACWIWLVLPQLFLCLKVASAQTANNTAFFCPCMSRESLRFSFLMHNFGTPPNSKGALLLSGVRQAARDRGVRLTEYFPVQVFSVTDATNFLDAEVQAGTSGIVTTLYSDQLLPSLRAANAAGVPVYIVGGADPDLLASLQRSEPPTGPVRASLRCIGRPMHDTTRQLAAALMAAGIRHVECVSTDIGDALFFARCNSIVEAFRAAGLSGNWQWRAAVIYDIRLFVEGLEVWYPDIPGRAMALVLMDTVVYRFVKARLPRGTKGNATLVVYETSLEALDDIRHGRPVLALDSAYYTQGYLALALAAAEVQTGQMVTSDVVTGLAIYGGEGNQSLPVTDEVMQHEVCRAAGSPVCWDPGVVPVTPSGCRCFDRHAVRYKVISGLPERLPVVHGLWQGMADAERDLPGSTFDWQVYQQQQYSLVGEYKKFVRSHRYYGAITLDTLLVDLSAELAAAVQSIPASGRPLYLAYGKAAPRDMRAFLGRFGAHNFVGVNPFDCGREVSQFGVSTGSHHVLANNAIPFLPWTWELMRGIVSGVVGDDYAFPPGVWDWPITRQGDPNRRRGAWSLWVARDSNNTAEIMNGMLPVVGEAFIPPLAQRLSTDVPAPDLLVLEAYHDLISSATMAMLADLAAQNPVGPPIQLATHKCTATDMLALARQGAVKGEELLLGCMDEQPYMSTYLSATLAALEQQTGERVVGGVDTARLIKASQLPPHFMRRVSCEMDNLIRGIMQGRLGVYFPVCHARRGCVDSGLNASRGAVVCSGRGSCRFPTHPNPSGETDPTQGTCRCNIGWNGTYCQHSTAPVLTDPPHPHDEGPPVLLIALLFGGAVLGLATAVAAALLFHARRTRGSARELQKLLHKRVPPRGGECIAVVVTDIESSTLQWEWNADAMNAALAIHHKVLRALLPKYYGYESDTEGDSFTLIFHDAVDALGWAMDVQRQLLFPGTVFQAHEAMQPASCVSLDHCTHRAEVPLENVICTREQECLLDWPPELLGTEACKEVKDPLDGSVLYRGLRVRMGIHIGVPDACNMHPNGRQHYQGEVVELAKAIQGAAASGGQVLMSMVAWHSLGMHMRSVICHHMGMHEVCDRLPHLHIMQVLPLELARRAPFRPLTTKQFSPSFFEAPCATECYLTGKPPREPVVICFMYVGRGKELSKVPGYQQAIELLVWFVQSRLSRYDAYECEEKDGMFMLAFRSAVKAACFAEAIQQEAMALPWPPHLLEQEAAAEVVKLASNADGTPRLDRVVFRWSTEPPALLPRRRRGRLWQTRRWQRAPNNDPNARA